MSRVEQFLLGSAATRSAIQIGLVNSMPDAMLRTTELQFARLLKDGRRSPGRAPSPFFLTLHAAQCGNARPNGRFYDDAALLEAADIDALILTGAAPDAADPRQDTHLGGTHPTDRLGPDRHPFHALFRLRGPGRRAASGRDREPAPGAQTVRLYDSRRVEDDPLFLQYRTHRAGAACAPRDIAGAIWRPRAIRVLARLANQGDGDGQADIFTREPPGSSQFVFSARSPGI
jgi:hypothetical protein